MIKQQIATPLHCVNIFSVSNISLRVVEFQFQFPFCRRYKNTQHSLYNIFFPFLKCRNRNEDWHHGLCVKLKSCYGRYNDAQNWHMWIQKVF